MTREKTLEAIKDMPAEFSLDELVERLALIEKIEKAIKEVEEGKGIPHAEVKRMIAEWGK